MGMLPKGEHIRGKQREYLGKHLSELYREGKSLRHLATYTGRSYGFVRRILKENGVKLYPKGGSRRK